MINNYITEKIIENNQKPTWNYPGNIITGEALELLQDFIKYSELNIEAMANLMYYNPDGFRKKLNLLKKSLDIK